MKLSIYTDKGNFRNRNEDNYIIKDLNDNNRQHENEGKLIAVADGMGGHQAGEIASQMAVNILQDFQFNSKSGIIEELMNTIHQINEKIISKGNKKEDYRGMGTTLSAAVIINHDLYIGHVGDSRIYLLRGNNLKQLTTDDTLVQQLVKNKKIKPEEAFGHPRSHILTQGLGLETELKIETDIIALKKGDYLLFCTDGLSDMLTYQEIKRIILANTDVRKLAGEMGRKALENGGRDNLTIIACIIN